MAVATIIGVLAAAGAAGVPGLRSRDRRPSGRRRLESGHRHRLRNRGRLHEHHRRVAAIVTKYVASGVAGATRGEITITYNAANVGLAANQTIVLSPFIAGVVLSTQIAAGNTGAINRGCQSAVGATSTA